MKTQVYKQQLATMQPSVVPVHHAPSLKTQFVQSAVFLLLIIVAIALNFGAAVLTGVVWNWLQ